MQGSYRTIELSEPRYESQGLRWLTVKTPNLKGRGDICLYVPKVDAGITDLPIHILLHGVYGSAWAWALKGGAHLTAHELITSKIIRPAIVAMPSDGLWGDGSAYRSHHHKNFDLWIVDDVVKAIQENIPGAGPQSNVCIGGLSMGGYGALMLGCRYPDKFSAISGHSAITKLQEMTQFVEEPIDTFSSNIEDQNVIDTIKRQTSVLPALRFDCGTEDQLIDGNRLLHSQLTDHGTSHTYQEHAGGHEWSYWQEHVRDTFVFFNKHI